MKAPNLPAPVRKYIYAVIASALPVFAILGVVEFDDVAAWLGLAAALLAVRNVES